MKKRIIIISTIVLIIVITGVIIGFTINRNKKNSSNEEAKGTEILVPVDMNNLENAKMKDDEKVNISKDLLKDREIQGLKLTNISLKTDYGTSSFAADVTNTSDKDFNGGTLTLKFINNEGVQFATLDARVQPIKAGKKVDIAAKTTADLVNAKDFTVELAN